MEDVSEAKELIQRIRDLKRVDEGEGNDENANDLQNALRLLSEELYSKPTHFILELIQNADDNKYDADTTPALSIIFRTDGYLWIGCNELGFAPDNVRAICRIGGSTKKVHGSRKGYIGEKGIGFKSVFKVADVVWITSGALSFQFDKKKSLGMIAPDWCDFKSHPLLEEKTIFCFHIQDAAFYEVVENDLLKLEPELLLFLRQLRKINVRIEDASGNLKEDFAIARDDGDRDGLRLTALSRYGVQSNTDNRSDLYTVCRHTAIEMPHESRREGVTESEVTIAFPVNDELGPKIKSCLTYSFLPVRSYGLPFVLQGDFILSANREDILQSHGWNQAIIRSAQDVFVESVKIFNAHDALKFAWPRYLAKQHDAYDTALHGFLDRLLKFLKSKPVIQTQAQTMETPKRVDYVSELHTDIAGKPLLAGRLGMQSYPLPGYSFEDLAVLGIQQMSVQTFLSLLRIYSSTQHSLFKQQPALWHSRVARALAVCDPSDLYDLQIIPFRGGDYFTAANKKLYLPSIDAFDGNESVLALPNGIHINTIDDEAARDRHRSKLYVKLGARHISPAEVCRIVLEQHKNHGKVLGAWSVEDIVSHAWFLFTSPDKPANYDLKNLRIAAENSKSLFFGSNLYMDLPGQDDFLSRYFGTDGIKVHYIDSRYLTFVGDADADRSLAERWMKWLQTDLGVRTIPKLSDSGLPSREFQYIIDHYGDNEWLVLLKAHWSQYTQDLIIPTLRGALSKALVKCSNGQRLPLGEVYLGCFSLKQECLEGTRGLPMLAVGDPNDKEWQKFQNLGLSVRPDVKLYLTVLKQMRASTTDKCNLKAVEHAYQGLERHFARDAHLVKQSFTVEALIYVETPDSGRWVSLDGCRWSAPKCLHHTVPLIDHYPNLRELFHIKLGVPHATASDVAHELGRLSGRDDCIEHVKELLMWLGTCVGTELWKNDIPRILGDKKIMPVRLIESSLRGPNDKDWFIADNAKVENSFTGRVALLDFSGDELERIKPLLAKLLVRPPMLTRGCRELFDTRGGYSCDKISTNTLRSKAVYISSLASASQADEVSNKVNKIEVFRTPSIRLRRVVMVNNQQVFGKDEQGHLVIEKDAKMKAIHVYIIEKDAAKHMLPAYALAEKLVTELELPKRMHPLVMHILSENDVARLEYSLEKADITIRKREPSPEEVAAKQVKPNDTHTERPAPSDPALQATAPDAKLAFLSNGTKLRANEPSSPITLANQVEANVSSKAASHKSTGSSAPPLPTIRDATNIQLTSDAYLGLRGRDIKPHLENTRKNMGSENDVPSGLATSAAPQYSLRTLGSVGGHKSTTEATQAADGKGDKFVYGFLMKEFKASEDCWTSRLREHHGLMPFMEDDSTYSAFTIDDLTVSERVTNWLIERGSTSVERYMGKHVVYHFDVKATAGRTSDSFTISAHQLKLAREWHESDGDVYVILRVYDAQTSSPKMREYVDPVGMVEDGQMNMAATDYVMKAT